VETVEVEPEDEGKVIADYARGYKIGDRLLRPARVKVGRHMRKQIRRKAKFCRGVTPWAPRIEGKRGRPRSDAPTVSLTEAPDQRTNRHRKLVVCVTGN